MSGKYFFSWLTSTSILGLACPEVFYSIKAFHDSTDFAAIKEGYYLGNLFAEPKILIKGPDLPHWNLKKR